MMAILSYSALELLPESPISPVQLLGAAVSFVFSLVIVERRSVVKPLSVRAVVRREDPTAADERKNFLGVPCSDRTD